MDYLDKYRQEMVDKFDALRYVDVAIKSIEANYMAPSVFTNNIPYLECTNREELILNKCKGKRVCHFGFLDAPFMAERYNSGDLLHSKIIANASYAFGIDINNEALTEYRKITGDNENCIMNIEKQNIDTSIFLKKFDVIIFGEILEHLFDPGTALKNLAHITSLNKGCETIITTPNAFFIGNFIAAISNIEVVHPEHHFWYSPTTLKRLMSDCGFPHVTLFYYSTDSMSHLPGATKSGLIGIGSI